MHTHTHAHFFLFFCERHRHPPGSKVTTLELVRLSAPTRFFVVAPMYASIGSLQTWMLVMCPLPAQPAGGPGSIMPYAGCRTSIILILVRALAWQCPARTAAPPASPGSKVTTLELVRLSAPTRFFVVAPMYASIGSLQTWMLVMCPLPAQPAGGPGSIMPYAGCRTSIILILVRALAWQCPARTAAPAASEDTTQQAQERVHTDAPRVPESADAEDEAIEEEAAEETVDADAAQGGSAEAFEEDTADATVDVDAGNPADSSARLQELNRILRIRDATNMAAETISQATCLEILGVAADAPLSDLRRRYRYLILLLHPDKCSLARAGEASIAVNRAYGELHESNTGGDAGPAHRDEDVGPAHNHEWRQDWQEWNAEYERRAQERQQQDDFWKHFCRERGYDDTESEFDEYEEDQSQFYDLHARWEYASPSS